MEVRRNWMRCNLDSSTRLVLGLVRSGHVFPDAQDTLAGRWSSWRMRGSRERGVNLPNFTPRFEENETLHRSVARKRNVTSHTIRGTLSLSVPLSQSLSLSDSLGLSHTLSFSRSLSHSVSWSLTLPLALSVSLCFLEKFVFLSITSHAQKHGLKNNVWFKRGKCWCNFKQKHLFFLGGTPPFYTSVFESVLNLNRAEMGGSEE